MRITQLLLAVFRRNLELVECLRTYLRWKRRFAGMPFTAGCQPRFRRRTLPCTDRSVFLLTDKPSWAFGSMVQHFERYLCNSWRVQIGYISERTLVDPSQFTLALLLGGATTEYDAIFDGRFIRGVYSHKWQRQAHPITRLRQILIGAAACIVPSKALLDCISPVFPSTFQVPFGADPKQFYWSKDRREPHLVAGWTGNPKATWKRLDQIVKPACKAAGVELRIASSLTREKLNLFYNDVDVVLVASEPLEGDPNALYEAGACGRAVIATRVGTVPELVVHGENGFVEEGTISAFSERLRWCREHVAEVRKMGQFHRERVLSNWTFDESSRKFSEVLEWVYARVVRNG